MVDGHDSQSYHEEWKESHLAASDVPEVLARHGYDWRDFLHEENYALLEQPAPRLCADRLDYFLRDSRDLGLSTLDQIHHALDHLIVHDRRIGVDDVEVARWLAYTFIAADKASWANFREVGLYEVTARAIKAAMQIGAITEDDFWGTDDQLWRKLHAIDNAEVQRQLRSVSPATRFEWDEVNPTFRVSTKLRTIDPDVLIDNGFQPLSTLDADFARYRSEYLSSNSGKWPMRVVSPSPELCQYRFGRGAGAEAYSGRSDLKPSPNASYASPMITNACGSASCTMALIGLTSARLTVQSRICRS